VAAVNTSANVTEPQFFLIMTMSHLKNNRKLGCGACERTPHIPIFGILLNNVTLSNYSLYKNASNETEMK
jgi:hypothetical protein